MLGMSALFLIVGVALNLFMPTYIPTLSFWGLVNG